MFVVEVFLDPEFELGILNRFWVEGAKKYNMAFLQSRYLNQYNAHAKIVCYRLFRMEDYLQLTQQLYKLICLNY